MTKIFAYIKKSFLIALSYHLAFFMGLLGAIISTATFFFIDKLFGHQVVLHLQPFGVNYFSYVLVGMAFAGFIGTAMGTVASQIYQEQMMGTLEALLITPTSIYTLITAMMCWNLLYALIDVIIYALLGIFVFKVNFGNINILSTLVITILSIISFNALGIISASFIIVFKRGDPVSWFMNLGMELLGGVYFPITVLPDWLQYFACFFPVTYAIRAVEKAIYQGASLSALSSDILFLLYFSVILVPLALVSFKYAVNRARQAGTLVQY